MLRVVSKLTVSKLPQEVYSISRSDSNLHVRTFSDTIGDIMKVHDVRKSDERTYNMHQAPKRNTNHCKLSLFCDVNKSKMSFDLENVPISLQEAFIAKHFQEIARAISKGGIQIITFNHLSESVFRYKLNMHLRKLGGTSEFQRYNHDRGRATFEFQQ